MLKFFIKNRLSLIVLLLFNFFGILFSFMTYVDDIARGIKSGGLFVIPFNMVSFWLFLSAFIFILFLLLNLKIPSFFGSLTFAYCFVYGLGCIIFYPLFMIFVKGFSLYHFFNIFAHGFVGFQSILFFSILKKQGTVNLILIGFLFLVKDIMDLFFGGFLYFVKFNFDFELKFFLIFMILFLQGLSLYLLSWKVK